MVDIPPPHARKIMGYVLVVSCIPLLVLSLVEYLFTAYPSIGTIERYYTRDVYLEGGKFFYIYYDISESTIILNQTLHISLVVTGDEVVDFYVMSNSQYEEWKNGSSALGMMEVQATNQEDSVFVPPVEDRYYLVLDNTPYDASKSIHFQSAWIATAALVNYSEAFNWLKMSLIAFILLTVGNFLSENSISLVVKKLQQLAYLKAAKDIRGSEYIKTRIEHTSRFFWLSIGLLATIASGVTIYNFVKGLEFFRSFPELFPMSTDVLVRLFLYYILAFISLSLLFLLWMWLCNFIDDLDLWYFVKKKKLSWNPKLRVLSFHILKRILISVESFICYIAAVFAFALGYFLAEYRFPLFAGGILIISVPFSRAAFRSFREACEDLKLKWEDELKRAMPFSINVAIIVIFMIPSFLIALRVMFPAILNILEFTVIESFPGPRFQDYFRGMIHPQTTFIEALDVLTSDFVLYSALLFLLILILTEYLLPNIDERLTIKSKIKSLVAPAIVALLAFLTNELYIMFMEPTYLGKEEWSLFISSVSFGVSYLAGRAYEEAMK